MTRPVILCVFVAFIVVGTILVSVESGLLPLPQQTTKSGEF